MGFVGVEHHDPRILPQFLGYETEYARWAMQEVIDKARNIFQADAEKQSLLDATEKTLADFVTGGGYITYNAAVFVAQKPV